MKVQRIFAPLLFVLSAAAPAAAQAPAPAPTAEQEAVALRATGDWSGELKRGGTSSEFRLHLRSANGELTGKFDWPDLGYVNAKLLGARIRDGSVVVAAPLPVGSLKLSGRVHANRFEGSLQETTHRAKDWVTLPPEGTFSLRRAVQSAVPYRIEPVSFLSSGVRLKGQVYVPAGGGRHAGVIFIHGSGDSDRSDGAFFADRLAQRGIASLVYDKRGVGESEGDWHVSSYQELAQDAHSAIEELKRRTYIDPGRVGIISRSEGGWVAPLAVELGGTAFAVFVSGPTVTVEDEDLDDYRVALREAGISEQDQSQAFALLRMRHAVIEGKASPDALDQAVARARSTSWFPVLHWEEAEEGKGKVFREHTLGYDPAPHLKALGIPSLWLYGTDDVIIPAGDSVARLMALRIEPRPTIMVLPRADHALAVVDYPKLPGGVSKAASLIGDWIAQSGLPAKHATGERP